MISDALITATIQLLSEKQTKRTSIISTLFGFLCLLALGVLFCFSSGKKGFFVVFSLMEEHPRGLTSFSGMFMARLSFVGLPHKHSDEASVLLLQ